MPTSPFDLQAQQKQREKKIKSFAQQRMHERSAKATITKFMSEYQMLINKVYEESKCWFASYFVDQSKQSRKSNIYKTLMMFKQHEETSTSESSPLDELIPYLLSSILLESALTCSSIIKSAETIRKSLYQSYDQMFLKSDQDAETLGNLALLCRLYLSESKILHVIEMKVVDPSVIGLTGRTKVVTFDQLYLSKFGLTEYDLKTLRSKIVKAKISFEPMVCPPVPHNNLRDKGGYLTISSPLLRKDDRRFDDIQLKNFNSETNPEFFNTINKLQETKYVVNTKLLDFVSSLDDNDFIPKYDSTESIIKTIDDTKSINSQEIPPLVKTSTKLYKQLKDAEGTPEYMNIFKARGKLIKRIDDLVSPLDGLQKELSKARSRERTDNIIELYKDHEFYLPLAVGSNGRVYYYCTDLSPQGDNYQKSAIHSATKQRMNTDGFKSLCIALGTLFNGFDKMVNDKRLEAVTANHEAIMSLVKDKDLSVLSLVDADEIYMFISLAIEYYNHLTNDEYETGVILYIDSCSSAIQINGLIQACSKCLNLSSIINTTNDKLEDAYMSVAIDLQESMDTLSGSSDAELSLLLNEHLNLKVGI